MCELNNLRLSGPRCSGRGAFTRGGVSKPAVSVRGLGPGAGRTRGVPYTSLATGLGSPLDNVVC